MFRQALLTLVTGIIMSSAAAGDRPPYGVGQLASAAELRAADTLVAPDGSGLPPGSATAAEGRTAYETKCAACHGVRGEGSEVYPTLVGGRGTLTSSEPLLTVGSYWPYATTVWDYINRAMPYQNPGSLTSRDVYALTAYILFLNKIVGENDVLDRQSLPSVRMPNRDGFVPDPRPDVP